MPQTPNSSDTFGTTGSSSTSSSAGSSVSQSGTRGMKDKARDLTEKARDLGDKARDVVKNANPDHEEGTLTRTIEDQTSKVPSIFYLGLAVASMAVSFGLASTQNRKGLANFIGLWAPTFLIMGLYNKIVKTHGSDSKHSAMLH